MSQYLFSRIVCSLSSLWFQDRNDALKLRQIRLQKYSCFPFEYLFAFRIFSALVKPMSMHSYYANSWFHFENVLKFNAINWESVWRQNIGDGNSADSLRLSLKIFLCLRLSIPFLSIFDKSRFTCECGIFPIMLRLEWFVTFWNGWRLRCGLRLNNSVDVIFEEILKRLLLIRRGIDCHAIWDDLSNQPSS